MQTELSIALLVLAVGFLFWKLGGNKLFAGKKGSDSDCGPDCNCS